MKQHFVDSSAFIAQSCADDQYHKEALLVAQKLQKENSIGITTDFVLSEVLTFLRSKIGHQSTVKFYQIIENASNLKIIYTNQKNFEQAIKVFEKYYDKNFSFTDCISFTIMQNLKIFHAFTFDQQFGQAGFEIIK